MIDDSELYLDPFYAYESLSESFSDLDENSNVDNSLNFRSSSFDPVKALFSDNVILPVSNAKPLNNAGRMRFLIPVPFQPELQSFKLSTRAYDDDQLRTVMRFKRKGAAQTAKRRSFDAIKRFLHRPPSSPFHMLSECIKSKERVRVWVRRPKCFETRLTGIVQAFDHHMTLFLGQVEETVIRLDCSIAVRSIPFVMIKGDAIISISKVEMTANPNQVLSDMQAKAVLYGERRSQLKSVNRMIGAKKNLRNTRLPHVEMKSSQTHFSEDDAEISFAPKPKGIQLLVNEVLREGESTDKSDYSSEEMFFVPRSSTK